MRNYWCYLLDRSRRRLKVAEFACANDDEAIAAARWRFAECEHHRGCELWHDARLLWFAYRSQRSQQYARQDGSARLHAAE